MKNLLLATLVLSATAMLASPQPQTPATYAAQSPERVEAVIPFAFRAGKVILQAGTYIFTFDAVNQVGWIESADRSAKIVSLDAYVKSGVEPRLEFRRDGTMMVLQPGSGGGNAQSRSRRTGVAELQAPDAAPGR